MSIDKLSHIVLRHNLERVKTEGVHVPALCGHTAPFQAHTPLDGHDRHGSAPTVMCPDCLRRSDENARRRRRVEQLSATR
ncbi:hypothetical protein [Rhodococcus sp. AH-ZY2]|uniref:hypothetical protein n=1 Tax=Rhodococcus sp. AH-ZY2 TaxID=3047468 RepID=UPI0027E114AF|nr:hypothetical protein [Rhodococcus sp. AH-ZY2]WML64765.1 hypothetical protein QNA09_08235 [Rhodococcus sp. AH-ZY2]